MADVGIDGQIELVNDTGFATGQLVAVQVKSGESYFHDSAVEWRYYPDQKHRFYWERYPMPVLLILHSPEQAASYWVDARQALKSPERSRLQYIAVPKRNLLQTATAEQLFASIGMSSRPFMPLEDVLKHLLRTESANASFPLSYLDLFANGLINIARSIYCAADIAFELASEILAETNPDLGVGIGPADHEFMFSFILFLAEQHLADIDIDQCLIDWYDHGLQPTLIAPLTSRGRALVGLVDNLQNTLETERPLVVPKGHRVMQEGAVMMYFTPSHRHRVQLIRHFRRAALALL